ncbi:MAG: restriction endonuclease [Nitrososphaeria archaeon]|nr:restriction endonuclease [Nitrososphaeria archaeon]
MSHIRREAIARLIETILKILKAGERSSISTLSEKALISKELVRGILSSWGILGDVVELKEEEKIDIALKALEQGVDGERISRYLNWAEFEKLVARAFEKAGYQTKWNIRLTQRGRRHQIDLLAYRGHIVLLIDCKHWKRPPPPSATSRMVEIQERRLMALKNKIESRVKSDEKLREIYFIPMVLSLYQPSRKVVNGHVFASIGNLRGLLDYVESAYFQIRHEKMKIAREQYLEDLLTRI